MKFNFLFTFLFLFGVLNAQDALQSSLDSIEYYILNSKSNQGNSNKRKLFFAYRAKTLSVKYQIDSLIIKSDMNLASVYLDNQDQSNFLKYSHNALKGAKAIKDTISIAHIYKNLGYHYYDTNIDSSYYYNDKAEKLFEILSDDFNRAVVLHDIALLQKEEKDLTGSELTSINALSLLDNLKDTPDVIKYRSLFNNNLGHLFKMLGQYDEAIKYYNIAIKIIEGKQGYDFLMDAWRNNLALAYRDSGKYELAKEYLAALLSKKDLKDQNPEFYAVIMDNYAQALLLSKDYKRLPGLFLKALKICDSLNNENNTIIINQHLAQYYLSVNKKDSAKYYAYRSKDISEKYSPDDLLRSYALLVKIEDDSIATKYYDAYIKLNDSLLRKERATRNKFARIQYETDKIEQENVQIAKERMWLLIVSIVLIITSFLIYVIITQRNKNKELQFIQKQQETNEEIYNLMLSQHENIEEARALEKKRISQELHDGVLGRLFGTRLSLDSLNMGTTVEAINTRGQYITELKNIEEDIRKVSHELNTDFVSGSGFVDIIRTLVETQTTAYALKYKLDFDGAINWDSLSNKNKIHIYRIVQESLHNIYKHANASLVNISFKLKNNVICLTIKDNGSGFDVGKTKSGIGLKNMNARIQDIKGEIDITSKKEKGTTVKIYVPI